MNRRIQINGGKRKNGFILVTGLVLLLIMSLIVLYDMATSISQEGASGDSQDKNLALQNAETALRYAENYVYSTTLPIGSFTASCSGGLCLPSLTGTPNWQSIDILNDSTHTLSLPAGYAANSYMPPRFIIEILGSIPNSAGNNMTGGSSNSGGTAYRITAAATGKQASTTVEVQSVFVKQ